MRAVIVLPIAGLSVVGFLVLATTLSTDTPDTDAPSPSPAARAKPLPAPLDPAVIPTESIDRASPEITDDAATDSNRETSSGSSDLDLLFSGDALLPKVSWDFVGTAGTPKDVLESAYFNPRNLTPDPATTSELEAIIDRHKKTVQDLETRMNGSRFTMLRDRYSRGELESQRIETTTAPTPLGKPSHPEEEIGFFSSGIACYRYRIQWGQDPSYDADRMEVFHAKNRAIKELRDFLRKQP